MSVPEFPMPRFRPLASLALLAVMAVGLSGCLAMAVGGAAVGVAGAAVGAAGTAVGMTAHGVGAVAGAVTGGGKAKNDR
jgi:hypothetical protein